VSPFTPALAFSALVALSCVFSASAEAHTMPDDATLFLSDDGGSIGALLVVRLGANSPASATATALDANGNGRVSGAEMLLASAMLAQQLPALPRLTGPSGAWRVNSMELARVQDNDRSWMLTIVYRAALPLAGAECETFGVMGVDGATADVQWQLSESALGVAGDGDSRGHAHSDELPVEWCLRTRATQRAVGDSQ
jgi:hypothetical protein